MTNSYTIFENEGEIDLRAIKTFGVNSKEGKNPFGFFGTGLKYAIAILLRNKQKVTIQIGLSTHTFDLTSARIRVDDFEIVTMNGEELGFTSQVGKNWKLWMAYRELYCNAMDESGTVSETWTLPEPTAGVTRVIIQGQAFSKVHAEKDTFILSTTPIQTFPDVDIHSGLNSYVFLKTIRVGQLAFGNKKSLFTYNIKKTVDLTEDRTLSYQFQARRPIVAAVLKSEDASFVRTILLAPEGFVESEFDFMDGPEPSETFLKVSAKLYANKGIAFNLTAAAVLKTHSKEDFSPQATELNMVEQCQLAKAITFCHSMRFPVDDIEIVIVDTLGDNILGLVENDKIYISRAAFDIGTKIVAGTLIEEYIHLTYGYADCTRAMQNYLFNKVISLGELLNGEPL